jgi:hypothetical protein
MYRLEAFEGEPLFYLNWHCKEDWVGFRDDTGETSEME